MWGVSARRFFAAVLLNTTLFSLVSQFRMMKFAAMSSGTKNVAVPPKMSDYTRPPLRLLHNTTLRNLVMAAGGNESCEVDYKYRNYPVHVQDSVNELLGAAMMREPNVAVENDKPPTIPNATKLCAVSPFEGEKQHPRPPLFVAYMFSHEIELLEARLYEGLGVVDKHFIAESGYTHRGHKKPKFVSELVGTRFRQFAKVIEIVNLDKRCPEYLETILRYRNMNPRPQIIWETQTAAQKCLAMVVQDYARRHAPDALVQVSDLDEIPLRVALASVKECMLPQQLSFPVPFSTTHNGAGKLCRPLGKHQVPGMLFKAANMTSQRRLNLKNAPVRIQGGVHLTSFGGSLVEFFKTSNHAEGGQMNKLGWLNMSYNPTVCNASREDWYRREELLCTDTATVIQPWLKTSPARRESLPTKVEDENLPWVIAKNRERYPCFFAEHKKCVDSYIDIML